MDAGRLEQQVASVDRGIAFLKQEHLAMLTGLQVEITHLKRRCHGECAQSKPLSGVCHTPDGLILCFLPLHLCCRFSSGGQC